MIPRDQLAHRPAGLSTNQKWQQLVDEMHACWNADDSERPEETVVSLDTAHFASNLILDALQDEERRVLILRHVQELSVAETAVQLNMTEDQVKKRTRRALSHAYRVAQERGLLHDLS